MKWQTVGYLIIVVGAISIAGYVACVPWINRVPGAPKRIIVEIGQLQTAIQSYKEKHDEFPPCLADANPTDRKVRFMRHLEKAFEQSAYGNSEEAFDRLNAQVQNGFAGGGQAYNFKDAGGTIRPLDLDTLDAAESIVFWLGGFPTPYIAQSQATIANRRIFGFHRDADDPMRRDAAGTEGLDPLRYRTDPFHQFDETRLCDQDDDGWFEYLPFPQVANAVVAPFVYFDAKCYVDSGKQPSLLGAVLYPRDLQLTKEFGFAVPYAERFTPSTNAVTWHNPETFQIVCGGLDCLYETPNPRFHKKQFGRYERRIVVLPDGTTYQWEASGQVTISESMSSEESDNLTNLSSNTIGEMATGS
ncbi:MAG: hypothetical protein C0483_03975 [Pirellula sp.]|nr:hypothetical protein [Pirellula sp.]